jgi:hypothetical protein
VWCVCVWIIYGLYMDCIYIYRLYIYVDIGTFGSNGMQNIVIPHVLVPWNRMMDGPLWCVSQPILEHPQYLNVGGQCRLAARKPLHPAWWIQKMICYIILQHTTAYYIITSYYMMYHHDVDISLLQARLLSICLPSTCSAGSETSPWSCVLISRWAASADFAGGSVPAVFRWSTLVPSMKASALIPKPFYMLSIPSGKLT